jgi:hypothetical protein
MAAIRGRHKDGPRSVLQPCGTDKVGGLRAEPDTWHLGDMHTVYLIAASIGCTLLLLQVALQLIGAGTEGGGDAVGHDVGHDLGHDSGLSGHLDSDGDALDHSHHAGQGQPAGFHYLSAALSLKSLSAFVGCFGLAGLATEEAGWDSLVAALGVAVSVGLAGVVLVVGLMRGLAALEVSGTVANSTALGHSARVYLRIPADRGGTGIITVQVGGREVEFKAVTAGTSIATGAVVEVVRQVDADTFEVVDVESGLLEPRLLPADPDPVEALPGHQVAQAPEDKP